MFGTRRIVCDIFFLYQRIAASLRCLVLFNRLTSKPDVFSCVSSILLHYFCESSLLIFPWWILDRTLTFFLLTVRLSGGFAIQSQAVHVILVLEAIVYLMGTARQMYADFTRVHLALGQRKGRKSGAENDESSAIC